MFGRSRIAPVSTLSALRRLAVDEAERQAGVIPLHARVVTLSIDEAVHGAERPRRAKDGSVSILTLPAGLRQGDRIDVADGEALEVRVAEEPHRQVVGDDLWITLAVDPLIVENGGRIAVDTPLGRRQVWAPRGLPSDAALRIRDAGLPPRGDHPQGCAYVKLVADPDLRFSAAQAALARFSGAWAPGETGFVADAKLG